MHNGIALVRRPGPRLSDGLVTHIERTAVDAQRAAEQHAAYRQALRDAGWDVREVTPADDFPDAAFVEDTAVFLGHRAVITHPGDPSRRGETASMATALTLIGVPNAELTDGTLDGGDVLRVGRRLFVGRSTRTDDDGIEALRAVASDEGIETFAVPVTGCLHLKTAATALPDGTVIANLDCVDGEAFAPLDVVAAPEPEGANVLVLDDRRVAVPQSAPETARLVEERGFTAVALDIGEFEKVEAGLTCLSVLLGGIGAD
ncbi:MAG TPA: arginine deiminase family protein [Solirubrobacteraceae bacterium]|jgi:dimethylargininase